MALTEAQRADIEQRVDEGVWFLDHVMPDWADHVDLSKLDMGAAIGPCGCIAVQVIGKEFLAAMKDLGVGANGTQRSLGFDGRSLGFDGFAWTQDGREWLGRDGWLYAHELWQEAVLDRRPNKLIGGERIPVPV